VGARWAEDARAAQASPTSDVGLLQLGRQLGLSLLEILTVSLALAVEEDAHVGCAVAFLQSPVGSPRPTLGLLSRAFARAAPDSAEPLRDLAGGAALQSGLLARVRAETSLPGTLGRVAPAVRADPPLRSSERANWTRPGTWTVGGP